MKTVLEIKSYSIKLGMAYLGYHNFLNKNSISNVTYFLLSA
jgi:hypothetical protein